MTANWSKKNFYYFSIYLNPFQVGLKISLELPWAFIHHYYFILNLSIMSMSSNMTFPKLMMSKYIIISWLQRSVTLQWLHTCVSNVVYLKTANINIFTFETTKIEKSAIHEWSQHEYVWHLSFLRLRCTPTTFP